MLYKDLSYEIIGIAMKIHRDLGGGFLEKVYENAFSLLLEKSDISFEVQKELDILYYDKIIGRYIADLIVEDKIIVELKTVDKITEIHLAQTINYLKISNKKLGLIINFKNKSLEYRRVVL